MNRFKGIGALLAVAIVGVAPPAAALQPLDAFRAAARTQNLDIREASEVTLQRDDEARQAAWKLLPSAAATASYQRNQYTSQVTIPGQGTATITPNNQLDATLTLSAPIVDFALWRRAAAADAVADAQHARTAATRLDADGSVVRAYYQVVAGEGVLAAARRTLAAAEASRDVVRQRVAAGLASELDGKRADAEVEARRQAIAEAEYSLAVARRSLETTSGLAPSDGAGPIADDLREEAPLATWESRVPGLPQLQAAALDVRAADKNVGVAAAALYPTVSASATERITNAAGFGQSPSWAAGVSLTWRFDASTIPAVRAQEAARAAAAVREERSRVVARDQIHAAWQLVHAQIGKSRAARAQLEANRTAASLAAERYRAGTATLLDLVVAERDAFSAEVATVQADADLAYGRAALRIAAGGAP